MIILIDNYFNYYICYILFVDNYFSNIAKYLYSKNTYLRSKRKYLILYADISIIFKLINKNQQIFQKFKKLLPFL